MIRKVGTRMGETSGDKCGQKYLGPMGKMQHLRASQWGWDQGGGSKGKPTAWDQKCNIKTMGLREEMETWDLRDHLSTWGGAKLLGLENHQPRASTPGPKGQRRRKRKKGWQQM